jgi:hypothetical protein
MCIICINSNLLSIVVNYRMACSLYTYTASVPSVNEYLKGSPTNKDMFCPDLTEPVTPLLTYPYKLIYVMIDVSGSTFNVGSGSMGRGGRGRVQLEGNDLVTTSDTKIIIVAELEAVAHTLVDIANKYIIDNVQLNILSFGSKYYNAISIKVNNELIHDIARHLDVIVPFDCGATATLPTLQHLFDEFKYNENVYLIIATDGRPSDSTEDVLLYMNKVYMNFKKNDKLLHITAIGAGSIKKTVCSRGYIRNTHLNIDTMPQLSHRNDSSEYLECDIDFLLEICKYCDTSMYLPACGKYELLFETLGNFNRSKLQWKVHLDDGMCNLHDPVNTAFNNIINISNKLIVSTFIGGREMHYLIVNTSEYIGYQIALQLVDSDIVTKEVATHLLGLNDMDIDIDEYLLDQMMCIDSDGLKLIVNSKYNDIHTHTSETCPIEYVDAIQKNPHNDTYYKHTLCILFDDIGQIRIRLLSC